LNPEQATVIIAIQIQVGWQVMKERSLRGHWWTPDDPEEKVAGNLSFSPKSGVELDLFGILGEEGIEKGTTHKTLYGVAVDGTRVELNNCRRTSYSFSGSTSRETYNANLMSLNEKGATPNVRFNEVYLSFPLLGDWIENIPRPSFEGGTSNERPQKVSISVDLPEERAYSLTGPEIYMRVKGGPSVSTTGGEINIKPEIRLHFENGPAEIAEWRGQILELLNMIAFATDEPITPNYVRGMTRYNEEDARIVSDVYYEGTESNVNENKHPGRFLFRETDYEGEKTSLIGEWFGMYSDLSTVLNTYCGLIYKNPYIEQKFSTIMSCIDGYYNRRSSNIKPSERSTADAIDYLLNRCDNSMENIHSMNIDRNSLIEKAAMTRDYYVHQTDDDGKDVAQGNELAMLSRAMQQLLDTALLQELQVSKETIDRGLSRKYSGQTIEF
jgi:hypothetical protein